jgi:hypothetical protein
VEREREARTMSNDETIDGGHGFTTVGTGQTATTMRSWDVDLIVRAATRHVDAYKAIEIALARFRAEETHAPYGSSYIAARVEFHRAQVEVDESWLALDNAVTRGGEP